MRTIIVTFDDVAERRERAHGPVMPNPGPPLPSALAETAIASSALSGTSLIAESIAMTDAPTAQMPT